MPLLNEKTLSDMESESGILDIEKGFALPTWAHIITKPISCVRSISWRVLFIRSALFFVPSFLLQGRHSREWTRPSKLHPTAYLDGMRGLAALVVFFCHYSYQGFIIAESYGCGDSNYAWFKLPIIRLFYQGPAAVCIFFVISGYALSYRPLKLIRSQSNSELLETLSSLVFRRAIRLFVPSIVSTFMIVCLLRLGAYEPTREFANDRTYMKNIVEPHPELMETSYEQFRDWLWSVYRFIRVFSWAAPGAHISKSSQIAKQEIVN